MKCGEFLKKAKDRITIQQKILSADNYGSQTNVWTTIGTVWAWIKPLSSFERVQNEQLRGATTHKMLIRYDSAYANIASAAGFRLSLDSRIHNIKGIKLLSESGEDYGKAFIEIVTEENAPEVA